MFTKRKEQELQELTPAALEAQKKQRSMNRVFGLFFIIALLLLAMLIVEIVIMANGQ